MLRFCALASLLWPSHRLARLKMSRRHAISGRSARVTKMRRLTIHLPCLVQMAQQSQCLCSGQEITHPSRWSHLVSKISRLPVHFTPTPISFSAATLTLPRSWSTTSNSLMEYSTLIAQSVLPTSNACGASTLATHRRLAGVSH